MIQKSLPNPVVMHAVQPFSHQLNISFCYMVYSLARDEFANNARILNSPKSLVFVFISPPLKRCGVCLQVLLALAGSDLTWRLFFIFLRRHAGVPVIKVIKKPINLEIQRHLWPDALDVLVFRCKSFIDCQKTRIVKKDVHEFIAAKVA